MAHKYGFASVNSQLNTGRDNQSTTQQQLNTLASNMISARVTDIILDDQHPKLVYMVSGILLELYFLKLLKVHLLFLLKLLK